MFDFIKKLLVLDGEEKISYETTCFKCKGTFPKEQLIGRRFHKYCRRCYWIDWMQMLGISIGVLVIFIIVVLFFARR